MRVKKCSVAYCREIESLDNRWEFKIETVNMAQCLLTLGSTGTYIINGYVYAQFISVYCTMERKFKFISPSLCLKCGLWYSLIRLSFEIFVDYFRERAKICQKQAWVWGFQACYCLPLHTYSHCTTQPQWK